MRISDWSSDVCSSDLVSGDPAAVERLPSWPDSRLRLTPAARWLLDHNGEVMPMADLIEGFCRHLLDEGIPLLRVSRSEEHTSELQSLMRISYAVFCL